jgi:hypothetical protein
MMRSAQNEEPCKEWFIPPASFFTITGDRPDAKKTDDRGTYLGIATPAGFGKVRAKETP